VDLYGGEGFASIRAAAVTVVGLGGVGSHAALALARSGIGALHLIDFDAVTESSLNRLTAAGPADVGLPKVDVVARHLATSCPDTRTRVSAEFFQADAAARLLAPPCDLVIDAIDSLNPKVALLAYCVHHGLPVVSSMGAAGRRDVAKVRVDDIADTRGCPLARRVRRLLRLAGVATGIACVYSIEPGVGALPPDEEEPQLGPGRVRRHLPSSIALPGIFGYGLASVALDRIASGRG
jgi:tRNA A37 threonylcarbamoyladenosine dehydratase